MAANKTTGTAENMPAVKGRKPKSMTPEQIEEHGKSMAGYYEAVKANRGYSTKYFESPDTLVAEIDRYMQCVEANKLYPTESGLMLFLDCTDGWYYAVMNLPNDERASVLKKFRVYVAEYLNQSGLSGKSNTIFSIYYLKSKLQQYDAPNEMTLNINMAQGNISSTGDFASIVGGMPVIDADYTELGE